MENQVRSLADVKSLVCVKGGEKPEGLLTHATSVWLRSTVHILVLDKLRRAVKGFAALVTVQGFS